MFILSYANFINRGENHVKALKNENLADFPKTPLFLIMPETPKDHLHSLGPSGTKSRNHAQIFVRFHAFMP